MTSASKILPPTFVLTFSCHDVSGIVARVTQWLVEHSGFIIESAQFGDAITDRFFMRCCFRIDDTAQTYEILNNAFTPIAAQFDMDWQLHDLSVKPKLLLLVSKHSHCLNDILHRVETGNLNVEITGVVSNHETLRPLVERHNISFHHFPIDKENKDKQEAKIRLLSDIESVDLVVLARYMQVLTPDSVNHWHGRCINIHHSFLPGFKGARPYHQAHERGVKLIGATAHYVSDELDEGPIIEQEVTRVDHTYYPENLQSAGRDMECAVLARAIRYHLEHRVLINGCKTVVFR